MLAEMPVNWQFMTLMYELKLHAQACIMLSSE